MIHISYTQELVMVCPKLVYVNESQFLSQWFWASLNGTFVCYDQMSPSPLQQPTPSSVPFIVRKQPWSGPREEKVPYLIISSQRKTHSASLLYVRSCWCWVPFGKGLAGERSDGQCTFSIVARNTSGEDQ